MKDISYKDFINYLNIINELKNSVDYLSTGDSRLGSHSYTGYTSDYVLIDKETKQPLKDVNGNDINFSDRGGQIPGSCFKEGYLGALNEYLKTQGNEYAEMFADFPVVSAKELLEEACNNINNRLDKLGRDNITLEDLPIENITRYKDKFKEHASCRYYGSIGNDIYWPHFVEEIQRIYFTQHPVLYENLSFEEKMKKAGLEYELMEYGYYRGNYATLSKSDIKDLPDCPEGFDFDSVVIQKCDESVIVMGCSQELSCWDEWDDDAEEYIKKGYCDIQSIQGYQSAEKYTFTDKNSNQFNVYYTEYYSNYMGHSDQNTSKSIVLLSDKEYKENKLFYTIDVQLGRSFSELPDELKKNIYYNIALNNIYYNIALINDIDVLNSDEMIMDPFGYKNENFANMGYIISTFFGDQPLYPFELLDFLDKELEKGYDEAEKEAISNVIYYLAARIETDYAIEYEDIDCLNVLYSEFCESKEKSVTKEAPSVENFNEKVRETITKTDRIKAVKESFADKERPIEFCQ